MQRFSILRHDHPYFHWDFLLETGHQAECWRLLREPCCHEPIAAEQLPPHRLLYLDYEGPVGNDRGAVQRIASGIYTILTLAPDLRIALIGVHWAQQAYMLKTTDGRLFWYFITV